jgi:hypothetical protein
MNQGIAGAYSRSGRAADRLGQPQYADIEALRRELEKHGAAPGELRYQLDQFEEAMLDGPLSREDIQRFFSDKDTGLSVDRNLDVCWWLDASRRPEWNINGLLPSCGPELPAGSNAAL